MEPSAQALIYGVKTLKCLPILSEMDDLHMEFSFNELVKIVIKQTIQAFGDLKEYHDIVLTCLEEEAITYRMAESFAESSETLSELSWEYHTLMGTYSHFIKELGIEDFKPNPVDNNENKELVMKALASKIDQADLDSAK